MVNNLVKNILRWIKEHVRPYARYRAKGSNSIDLKKDSTEDVIDKAKEQTEVGVKFTFKF